MRIGIPKERRAGERRVAASPDTVKKYRALGLAVVVEAGAGAGAAIPDQAFAEAGAELAEDPAAVWGADLVLTVQRPLGAEAGHDQLALMRPGALLIGLLNPYAAGDQLRAYAAAGVTALAMELVPRITRAQAMDVLSSQANLAGYRAVIDAAHAFGRAFPMMMTAAGTVAPARCLVMGVGVAGLQAIATAKRLGAIVSATDVRPAVKEQVQSLGASFVAVEDEEFRQAETAGGYAKEMSPEYQAKQAALIAETLKKQDLVITTAQIPGRPAPRLISAAMLRTLKPGAVVVDLAVETGGNVEGTVPGEVVARDGVTLIGHTNMPSRIAVDASALYARNLLALVQLLVDADGRLAVPWDDEIVQAIALTREGALIHPRFAQAAA